MLSLLTLVSFFVVTFVTRAGASSQSSLFRQVASRSDGGLEAYKQRKGVRRVRTTADGRAHSYGQACRSFVSHSEADLDVGTDMKGSTGNEWSPCTHLRNYGLNFAPFFARFLAYQLAPKTAMEFGCGLGTTSDFVARFAGAQVTCIEPEATLGQLISSLRDMGGNGHLDQLALNVFSEEPAAKDCVASGDLKSDLVFSVEVAEHIPAKFHPQLINLLANSTKKWLVFSAARPEQKGTGHLPESMHLADYWREKFEHAGLVYMPKLTELAQESSFPLRSYDLFANLLVFRNPKHKAEDTNKPHEMLKIYQDKDWWGSDRFGHKVQEMTPAWHENHQSFVQGSNAALWPRLTAMEAKAKSGHICREKAEKGASSLLEGATTRSSGEKPAFESAWGSHFYGNDW